MELELGLGLGLGLRLRLGMAAGAEAGAGARRDRSLVAALGSVQLVVDREGVVIRQGERSRDGEVARVHLERVRGEVAKAWERGDEVRRRGGNGATDEQAEHVCERSPKGAIIKHRRFFSARWNSGEIRVRPHRTGPEGGGAGLCLVSYWPYR